MIRRIMDFKLERSRSVVRGRPNLRWMDGWCDGRYEENGDGRQGYTVVKKWFTVGSSATDDHHHHHHHHHHLRFMQNRCKSGST